MEKSIHSGLPVGVAAASKARMPHWAISQPNTPPAEESIRLSTSNWRTTRQRPAPRAARMEISRVRAEGPGQQQIGDVGAGDQEDESDSAEEGEEDQAQAVGRGHLVESLGEESGIAIVSGYWVARRRARVVISARRGVDRGARGKRPKSCRSRSRRCSAEVAEGMACQNCVLRGKDDAFGHDPDHVEGTELT